jgi:hypothetical protein
MIGDKTMKRAAFVIALLVSGAAIAQTSEQDAIDPGSDSVSTSDPAASDTSVPADDSAVDSNVSEPAAATEPAASAEATATAEPSAAPAPTQIAQAPAGEPVVQPGNNAPERDARGIAVISAAAMVPPGFNGVTGPAVGGPLLDPATAESVTDADASYPACSATVTDNCTQTYERGRA